MTVYKNSLRTTVVKCKHIQLGWALYINVGNITIMGDEVKFDSDQLTLTSISTGGPATTVTWTRDSTTVTEGTHTVLDDPETAQ